MVFGLRKLWLGLTTIPVGIFWRNEIVDVRMNNTCAIEGSKSESHLVLVAKRTAFRLPWVGEPQVGDLVLLQYECFMLM